MGQRGSSMATEDISHLQQSTKFTLDELKNLSVRFERLDRDRSGTLSAEELLSIPEFAMNPLAPRILLLLGVTKNQELDFNAFVRFLSIFHPKTPMPEKAELAFSLYDLDRTGRIRPENLLEVVRLMAGDRLTDTEVSAVIQHTLSNAGTKQDGSIGLSEFKGAVLASREDTFMTLSTI